ncbi:MAG: filamentous hemagglutinin N-terminal domain-containing protein [Oscillatoriales cyanobacterium]|nr:MAG: filamentous hemagglutinin N-terminal domain-containing protein [Oscillatoriales cyanobacterium]
MLFNPAPKRVASPVNCAFSWLSPLASALLLITTLETSAIAQIQPDRTLPGETQITTTGNTLTISGGTVSGSNLFHSFAAFSLPANITARFDVPENLPLSDTSFIINRITGSDLSQIDGILSTSAPIGLILINPNGISFGSTARLDFEGSFIATTADRLLFEDGSNFAIDNPDPILTMSVPIGAQFNGGNGAIRLSGTGTVPEENETFTTIGVTGDGLEVSSGQLVSLLASEVILEGALLAAPQGSVIVAGVERGTVIRQPNGRIDSSGIEQAGDVRFDQSSAINTADPEGSGSIDVTGRNLLFLNGSTLFTRVIDRGTGQGITLTATDTIAFQGQDPTTNSSSSIIAGSLKDGDGSDIAISAARVFLQDGGIISAGTGGGAGDAGDVRIVASESVEAVGVGQVLPTAILAVVGNNATGDGGEVTIEAPRVRLSDGALISVGVIDNSQGGNVTLRADEIEIRGSGVTQAGTWISGIGASVRSDNNREVPATGPTGTGGSVTLIADRVHLDEGAELTARSDFNAGGGAGNVTVIADRLTLNRDSTITTAASSGDRGNVFLNVGDLRVLNGSTIEASATGLAIGGSIAIGADTLALLESGTIRADAEQNFAGRVMVQADGVFLDDTSQISATSALGAEFSGVVQLTTPDVDSQTALVRLDSGFAPPTAQAVGRCLAENRGALYVTGASGLPERPSDEIVMRPTGWSPPTDRTYTSRGLSERIAVTDGSESPNLAVPTTGIIHEAITWRRIPGQIALIGEQSLELRPNACASDTADTALAIESPVTP